jgi:hypothetical protein
MVCVHAARLGEAGIGKTSLIRAAAHAADDGGDDRARTAARLAGDGRSDRRLSG